MKKDWKEEYYKFVGNCSASLSGSKGDFSFEEYDITEEVEDIKDFIQSLLDKNNQEWKDKIEKAEKIYFSGEELREGNYVIKTIVDFLKQ